MNGARVGASRARDKPARARGGASCVGGRAERGDDRGRAYLPAPCTRRGVRAQYSAEPRSVARSADGRSRVVRRGRSPPIPSPIPAPLSRRSTLPPPLPLQALCQAPACLARSCPLLHRVPVNVLRPDAKHERANEDVGGMALHSTAHHPRRAPPRAAHKKGRPRVWVGFFLSRSAQRCEITVA
jgi:hypothetical protein